jgi:thioesterase domain-containing protein
MLAVELEQYLHEHIPLSRAMAVGVASIDEGTVILRAPLAPNINHQESVFGGSASALAILAGWSLLHVRLRAAGVASRLVIQRNTVDYEQPLTGAFTARAWLEQPERWGQFTTMLMRKGKGRIAVSAVLEQAGGQAGRFRGEFVALAANEGTGRLR